MKKKVGAIIISAALLLGLSSTALANAKLLDGKAINKVAAVNQYDLSEAKRLLKEALDDKNFYRYNMAYTAIMKIQDPVYRDPLLGQLAGIMNDVWSPDVKKFNLMLDDLVKTNGSGKIYDEMEASVYKSNLVDLDKWYLLGELTSWGKRMVYSYDYTDAVDKVVYAWKMLSDGTEQNLNSAISDAETAVRGVRNTYSRDYLTSQIAQIKEKSEFSIIEIN